MNNNYTPITKILKGKIGKDNKFFSWPFFILYYFILKALFGLSYPLIYWFVIVILILGISFEYGALIFFIISMIAYLLGSTIEANHYFSFVYFFLFMSLLKYVYSVLKERFS